MSASWPLSDGSFTSGRGPIPVWSAMTRSAGAEGSQAFIAMRDDSPLRCEDGLVHVAARTSPFLAERIRLEVAAGGSVGDLLAAMRLPRDVPARIFVTSRLVPDSDRERIFPAPGDVVTIRVIPQGGNKALGAILEFVVVAAAAAATFYVGGSGGILAAAGFSSATATAGGAVAGATVGLVGSLITRALIPPPTPSLPKFSTDPASFSISGNQNLLAPFSPIPRVYGSRLVSPMLAAAPFTEYQGKQPVPARAFRARLRTDRRDAGQDPRHAAERFRGRAVVRAGRIPRRSAAADLHRPGDRR